jgi:signal transduction histidine kinase
MNLIENAIKFTSQGRIAVTIGGTGDAVTVAVTDSGIGIAPEDIPHLFQKFYRIDNSATRTIGGTGLGLYLCRTIVERFGGRVWVESRMGEGSSFKFSLPQIKSEELVATPVAKTAAPAAVTAVSPAALAAAAVATPVVNGVQSSSK